MKYRRGESKYHYWYGISRDENHLKLYDLIYPLEEKLGKELPYLRGIFYDYPLCCVEVYSSRSEEELRKLGKEIVEGLKNIKESESEGGVVFASCFFMVCSANCKEASEKGKRMFKALEERYGKEFATKVKKYMIKFHYGLNDNSSHI